MKDVCRLACALVLFLAACDPGADSPSDAERGYTIALGSRLIDTRATAPAAAASTSGYWLVKFPGPVSAAQLEALAASSRIYTYLPHDTFLVRPVVGTAASLGASAAIGAAWTGAYKPEYKISPAASDLAASALAETRTVMVTVFPDADLARVLDAAAALPGATVVGSDRGSQFSRVRLRVAGDALAGAAAQLAAIDDVFWVDVEGRRVLLNDTTIWVGQSGLDGGQTTPIFDHGIHGEGQVVGYIDTGNDVDSCYFRDPAVGLPAMNACDGGTVVNAAHRKILAVDFLASGECTSGIANNEWDTQGHGSHVGGTIAGDNFANPILHDPGDGMAPGAKLVVQDAGFRTDNCGDLPGIGCPVVDLKPLFLQAYTQGARIHTNSWGDQENAAPQNNYTAATQDVDEFMFTHPDFLILFAAGNEGPGTGTVGSPSVAKNGLSVGATQRGANASSLAGFSSCGPTADGRIKPDLTMPGQGIVSARNDTNVTSNNCTTTTMSGTSMASPAAAGMAALVRQYYTDGFYPSGAAVAADGFTPSAALIKATMLGSTKAMTGTGVGVVPDQCQGWGRVLLDDALFFTGQPRKLLAFDDAGFAQAEAGATRTFTVAVGAGQSLRATLAWTDFPSTPAAGTNLNNDLDLEVSGPSGTFRGNVFSAGQSTPGGTADRLNNVEQVSVNAPVAGTYTLTVRAFNVPSSAQPFALVIAGDVTAAAGDDNRAPIANAGPDASATVNTQVTLDGSASSDPDGDALTFSWTQTGGPAVVLSSPNAAIAQFTPAVPGTYAFTLQVSDGRLQAEDSVVITASLAEAQIVFADDFEGNLGWNSNPARTDTATSGRWVRGRPQATTSGGPKQLAALPSGTSDLVTGPLAGATADSGDVDGGITSIQSPVIAIPVGGTIRLSLSYYFAHGVDSTPDDFFRVQVVGSTTTTVLEERGSAVNDDAVFTGQSVDISAFAGQSVRILIQTADLGTASLVEAAVDDVLITRQ